MQNRTLPEPEWYQQKIFLSSKVDRMFWCKMLNCNERNLQKAIGIIGNSPKLVNKFLELNRLKENTNY
ncbi:MAG: hypothetical protein K0S32_2049 [Bacteroidetes bacterium]|jgi:hypothetical protein|nr:hypothetical protein [Bacteroidota bacterium]